MMERKRFLELLEFSYGGSINLIRTIVIVYFFHNCYDDMLISGLTLLLAQSMFALVLAVA